MIYYIIQGFLLGLAYVAPIGTQNIFVINASLSESRKRVLLTAFSVMFFDVSLSVACFFGMGALMSASVWLELALIMIGSIVVIYMGISLLRAKPATEQNENSRLSLLKIITTSCVVTWFNPQAIIDGSMLLGASKAAIPPQYGAVFIISCAMASVVWWLALSMIVFRFKRSFSAKVLRVISVLCGIFIILYGCKLLWSGVGIIQKTWF